MSRGAGEEGEVGVVVHEGTSNVKEDRCRCKTPVSLPKVCRLHMLLRLLLLLLLEVRGGNDGDDDPPATLLLLWLLWLLLFLFL